LENMVVLLYQWVIYILKVWFMALRKCFSRLFTVYLYLLYNTNPCHSSEKECCWDITFSLTQVVILNTNQCILMELLQIILYTELFVSAAIISYSSFNITLILIVCTVFITHLFVSLVMLCRIYHLGRRQPHWTISGNILRFG